MRRQGCGSRGRNRSECIVWCRKPNVLSSGGLASTAFRVYAATNDPGHPTQHAHKAHLHLLTMLNQWRAIPDRMQPPVKTAVNPGQPCLCHTNSTMQQPCHHTLSRQEPAFILTPMHNKLIMLQHASWPTYWPQTRFQRTSRFTKAIHNLHDTTQLYGSSSTWTCSCVKEYVFADLPFHWV